MRRGQNRYVLHPVDVLDVIHMSIVVEGCLTHFQVVPVDGEHLSAPCLFWIDLAAR